MCSYLSQTAFLGFFCAFQRLHFSPVLNIVYQVQLIKTGYCWCLTPVFWQEALKPPSSNVTHKHSGFSRIKIKSLKQKKTKQILKKQNFFFFFLKHIKVKTSSDSLLLGRSSHWKSFMVPEFDFSMQRQWLPKKSDKNMVWHSQRTPL